MAIRFASNGATHPLSLPRPRAWAWPGACAALRSLEAAYHLGTLAISTVLFCLGGFIPVLSAWLDNRLRDCADIVRHLGGVRLDAVIRDPDADLGPPISRYDAPELFQIVQEVAARLGTRPPDQIRLTYLPCCGVTQWRGGRALLVGLPLLPILTRAELRAILAHEIAHLARGDALCATCATRFLDALQRGLDQSEPSARGPLRYWALLALRLGQAWIAPVARGQERRADRAAAQLAGGPAAASALVHTALVQPLFREVLDHYDPAQSAWPTLYGYFRAFWTRLPEPTLTALRHDLLARPAATRPLGSHPALLDRLQWVQAFPQIPTNPDDKRPAATALGDLEAQECALHNRLYATPRIEPTTFHRAGSR